MPCCIAIIHFLRCNHSSLRKLGCTSGECHELCEPQDRQTLLTVKYLWSCEECQQLSWDRREAARDEMWASRIREVEADNTISDQVREADIASLQSRAFHEDVSMTDRGLEMIEDVQWFVDWAVEYASMLWDWKYEHVWERDAAQQRLEELRSLRTWDIAVTKDVTMSRDELLEQTTTSSWIAGRHADRAMMPGLNRGERVRSLQALLLDSKAKRQELKDMMDIDMDVDQETAADGDSGGDDNDDKSTTDSDTDANVDKTAEDGDENMDDGQGAQYNNATNGIAIRGGTAAATTDGEGGVDEQDGERGAVEHEEEEEAAKDRTQLGITMKTVDVWGSLGYKIT